MHVNKSYVVTLCIFALVILLASGCRARKRGSDADFDRSLAPGERGLQLIEPSQYPRFSLRDNNVAELRTGLKHSVKYLQSPSAAGHFPINGIRLEQVLRGVQKFDRFLQDNPQITDHGINDYIRRHFLIYRSVGYDRRGSVLFTGYYTPIFKASKTKSGVFQYPLYKRPADLVSGKTGKEISQQRLSNGGMVPYPTRQTIERSGMLAGTELCYLSSAFDAYVIHVQGSARLRLEDGSLWEIGYNGTNGHEYKSVGFDLIKDGHFKESELSLQRMRLFFEQNPAMVDRYINKNPRFVFFKATTGGPFGSLGQTVTADVSIATDKSIFPRGALCWAQSQSTDQQLRQRHYASFRLDQDTGGAIRAPGRCDLYMGVGPHAEKRAGRQMAVGQLYYLVAR